MQNKIWDPSFSTFSHFSWNLKFRASTHLRVLEGRALCTTCDVIAPDVLDKDLSRAWIDLSAQ